MPAAPPVKCRRVHHRYFLSNLDKKISIRRLLIPRRGNKSAKLAPPLLRQRIVNLRKQIVLLPIYFFHLNHHLADERYFVRNILGSNDGIFQPGQIGIKFAEMTNLFRPRSRIVWCFVFDWFFITAFFAGQFVAAFVDRWVFFRIHCIY